MDNTRETEVARRWLLSDSASAAYRYWRDVTRELIAETKGLGARPGWTRREAAALVLTDPLQTDIAGDSRVLVADLECIRNLSTQSSITSIGGLLQRR